MRMEKPQIKTPQFTRCAEALVSVFFVDAYSVDARVRETLINVNLAVMPGISGRAVTSVDRVVGRARAVAFTRLFPAQVRVHLLAQRTSEPLKDGSVTEMEHLNCMQ